ncbi:MAG: hypothetical protein O3B74_03705, partial [Proteobacteria bacterium]|nr:hypothetical protein [Pseudomonadota bacterium]
MILTLFFDWGAALRNSLPGRVQRLLGLGRPYAVIQPDGDGWALFQARGGMIDARGSAGQAQLAKRLTELEGPVVVVLPDDLAMRSDLTLPDTARRSLDQVLDVEIERLTPFKSTDVALTREIHAAAGGQIRVELTIVPRARIEALIAP